MSLNSQVFGLYRARRAPSNELAFLPLVDPGTMTKLSQTIKKKHTCAGVVIYFSLLHVWCINF